MSNIIVKNGSFWFEDAFNQTKEILKMHNNLVENKSRIPFHSAEADGLNVRTVITGLIDKHRELFGEEGMIEMTLIDIIIISFITKTSQPVKVCLMGCGNTALCYHIAELTGIYNPESMLYMINDEIENNANNLWLETVSMAEHSPEMSVFISDYDKTGISDEFFDIVIINGEVNYENPYNVIKETERIVKKGGKILCFLKDNLLLGDCFDLIFDNKEEYIVSEKCSVAAISYDGTTWSRDSTPDIYTEVKSFFEKIKVISDFSCKETVRSSISIAESVLNKAVKEKNLYIKKLLISIKEILIKCMLDAENRNFYKNKLFEEIIEAERNL